MIYQSIEKAVFLRRPNRFIAEVLVDGVPTTVHVKNTGRCRELLTEGATVYLEKGDNPQRKTPYDLVAVEKVRDKDTLLINMDSQIPNTAAAEWLAGGLFSENANVRREVTFGNSRFDFYIEDGEEKAFLEVKGVTLERDGIAYVPDAPTERGVKHIGELCEAKRKGYAAYILFLVQMKGISAFKPNDSMHKAFGDALRKAAKEGVTVLCYDCLVTPDSMIVDAPVPIELGEEL